MKKRSVQSNPAIKKAVGIAAVVCLLSFAALFVSLRIYANRVGDFVPPPFESAAVQGIPQAPQHLGYAEVYQPGMDFKAGLCGAFYVVEGKVDVYFTNLSEDAVWMKLRVLDSENRVIGETGLIKNGEYLQSLALDALPKDGEAITMKIMAYEPETYYSLGSVALMTAASIVEDA